MSLETTKSIKDILFSNNISIQQINPTKNRIYVRVSDVISMSVMDKLRPLGFTGISSINSESLLLIFKK